jgi:hypothetical protein
MNDTEINIDDLVEKIEQSEQESITEIEQEVIEQEVMADSAEETQESISKKVQEKEKELIELKAKKDIDDLHFLILLKKIQLAKIGFKDIKKKKENKFSNYKYADLNEIFSSIKDSLNKYNLYLDETYIDQELALNVVDLETGYNRRMFSKKIEKIELKSSNAAQQEGAAITYFRRYAIQVALGLIAEDDIIDSSDQNSNKNNKNQLPNEKQNQQNNTQKTLKYNSQQLGELYKKVINMFQNRKVSNDEIKAIQQIIKNFGKGSNEYGDYLSLIIKKVETKK